MNDLINALFHGVVYALVGGAMLLLGFFILDLITPGRLGRHLHGVPEGTEADRVQGSYSGGLMVGAWLIGNAAIIFTAIWTNGETSLGMALAWTVAFGLVGIVVNTLMLIVVDVVTPGNLRGIVCTPGPAVPLAYMAAASAIGISAVVCASIA